MMEKEVLAAQCPSTQKILEAHAQGKTGIDWDAPFIDWKLTEESATPRDLPVDQVIVYRQMQSSVERNAKGDSSQSSVTQESKDRAVNAFICSPPVPLEGLRAPNITNLGSITGADLKSLRKYQEDLETEKELKIQARRWWITRLAIISGIIIGLFIWWYMDFKNPTQYPGEGPYKGKL